MKLTPAASVTVANATPTTPGLVVVPDGTATDPRFAAARVIGILDDGRIPDSITRDTELQAAVLAIVSGASSDLDTFLEVAQRIVADESTLSALTTTIAAKAGLFSQPRSVQTTAVTAAPYEIVSLDTTGGTVLLTGPTNGAPFGARWKLGTTQPTIVAPNGYTILGAASIGMSLPPGASSGEFTAWQAFGTDYQPIAGMKPQPALDLRHGTILNTHLTAWAITQAFRITSLVGARDAKGQFTTANIVWPDGSTGLLTVDSTDTSGAVLSWHATYIPTSGSTRTVTQPVMTRDPITGQITAQPAPTIA